MSPRLACPLHGPVEPRLSWRRWSDGRLGLAARCPSCSTFLGWAPQRGAWLELAPPAPITTRVVAYDPEDPVPALVEVLRDVARAHPQAFLAALEELGPGGSP